MILLFKAITTIVMIIMNINRIMMIKRPSIWRGDESRSRRYVCKVMEEIRTLRLLNFVISIITAHNVVCNVSVKPVWATDLGFLDGVIDGGLYSGATLFCPYCVCPKQDANKFHRNFRKRTLKIDDEEIDFVFCSLHCKQAITRKLLDL